MAQSNREEMDLFDVFDRINKLYNRFLGSLYKGARFLARHWWVFLILIVGGYFLGQAWENSTGKIYETKLIVQNNFDSSSYVYDALENLRIKSRQADRRFLIDNSFDPDAPEITDVIVEPIVNIVELLEKQETNDRNLDSYISRADFEEDILLSEVFFTEYKYHRILLYTTTKNKEVIQKVMDYLNNNDLLNEVKDITIAETRLQIERNNQTIKSIDEVFDEFAGKNAKEANPSQLYFTSNQNNNLHQMVDKKTELINLNEELLSELTKYDNISTLINRPEFYGYSTLSDKKAILLPIYLTFAYVFFFVLRGVYRKGKKVTEESGS